MVLIVFPKIDLRSANHQLRMREIDEYNIAFKIRKRLYERSVVPIPVIKCTKYTLTRLMTHVRTPLLEKFVVVYIDDILVNNDSL